MRKYYIDNIRWATVLLVLVYHVFYLFNGVGVLGGAGGFSKIQYQDAVLYFVYPWFMVLLFLIAGISSRYALEHRSHKQFIKDRTVKLLVPSALGLFVFQWMVGYFNIKLGGAWDMIPAFIRYPVMAISGVGPLWFIQMLWVFSLLLVVIRKIDSEDKFYMLCGKCNFFVILFLFLPLWGASQILNMPVATTYRFGIYFAAFLIGYFIFSHDRIQDEVQRIHLPMLMIAVGMGIAYTAFYFGRNYADGSCLKSIFTNVYLWMAILAILGCGKTWFNKTSKFAAYMTKSSFGIYIVHYLVVLSTCFFLKFYTALPVYAIYLIAILSVLIISPALYELLKRIPILRYMVLGIQTEKIKEQ
ncbi:MAG TPA: acyltransferase [Oscillospiraceae bacterium]|nr:acyltransferase [Oscillospiraceae bacterium]HRW56295.1 acyltransferase [Oscillospiraceae bacterium]